MRISFYFSVCTLIYYKYDFPHHSITITQSTSSPSRSLCTGGNQVGGSIFGMSLTYPCLPCNPLYTHLTPDTPRHSHTLSSQVLAAADLSTNTCWGQLNLCTSRRKNTSTEEREGIWAGGGGGGGGMEGQTERGGVGGISESVYDTGRQPTDDTTTVNWYICTLVKSFR